MKRVRLNVRHCEGNYLLADTDKIVIPRVFSAKYRAALTASKRPIMKMVRFLFFRPSGMLTSSARPVLLLAVEPVLDCISTVLICCRVPLGWAVFMDLFGSARVIGAWMAFSQTPFSLGMEPDSFRSFWSACESLQNGTDLEQRKISIFSDCEKHVTGIPSTTRNPTDNYSKLSLIRHKSRARRN